jgi:1-acyl-sn-glycerol-3-phosphate acyltransferase
LLAFRSLLFSVLFYGLFAASAVAAAIISVVAPKSLPPFAAAWSRTWLKMYRAICGVSYEVIGREHLPVGGCLLAIKHQSVWDTCALFAVFDRPVFVLKAELMLIPFFGWALARLGCIPVKRGTGKSALDNMVRGTRIALDEGKQVVIFPEGTRTRVGDKESYKTGIAHLYKDLGVACVPVALNSGLFWPRHSFLRPAGVVRIKILETIPPGMGRKPMFNLMVERIESAVRTL